MNDMNAPAEDNTSRGLLDYLRGRGVKILLEDGNNIRLLAPSGLLNENLKQRLKENKADIISLLENRWSSTANEQLTPNPDEQFEPFPLTDIQRAYWVGRQQAFEYGDVSIHFYTEVECWDLDIQGLEKAWNQVVRRHDMLRAIVKDDGEQQILPEVDWYHIRVNRLTNLSEQETPERLGQIRERLSHSRRATDEWPGFGVEVSILNERRARLHISIDLLHVDGASLHIIFDDWSSYYRDENAVLPPLTLCYRDYVLAELKQQNSEKYQQDLAYWKRQITQLPPAPILPIAKTSDTSAFVRYGFKIDEITFQRLKKRASALGITPTMFVLTAFSEIIRHWSKEPSFTINVTLFNRLRVHPDVNKLVGDFTSMILLAVDYQSDESLTGKALRLQQRLWEHLDHRTVSGVKVLGELNKYQKTRSANIMPVVFTSLLDLKGQGFSTDWLGGFGTASYTLTQTPQVYLDHQIRELKDGGVECTWDVIAGIFPQGMVESMIAAYEKLLHDLVGDDAIWNESALSYTPAEQLAQREAINRTQQALGSGRDTLFTLFLDQAHRRECETAVVHADTVLAYGELRNAAQALGTQLREHGAKPDRVVAILMEKGWEQIVAALGIHAAGAAYLPIDVDQPETRVHYFLDNSKALAVVSQPHVLVKLTLPEGVVAITLDTAWLEANKACSTSLSVTCEPNNLSHVIYTSGSTGKPKGVMVEHRSVVNRLLDINQRYRVTSADKALALTALHHDLSVYDLFGLLTAGGQIIIPEALKRRDPAHWLELLVRHQVTIWNSVPAFLEILADYQEEHAGRVPSLPDSLRFIILAGDWIPVSLPSRIHNQRPNLQFVASGGPTETTIWDIYYDVGKVEPSWRSIPYGKPLANSQYHVLNKLLKPCPIWVPGEMFIGGAGLTRGYLGDEEKTAAKFILHPDTGQRLYRSGDMGRYLPDGNIEFLGREDFQVKIRGQRIELAEIEGVVKQLNAVRNALVQVHDGEHGKSLVLYVVPHAHAVADFDFRFDPSDTHTVADEESDFEQQRVQITDPAERLLFKMEQRGIRQHENAESVSLPALPSEDTKPWKSHREFLQDLIPLDRFGRFLGLLSGRNQPDLSNTQSKYHYGSAGGLYPVQTYVHVKPGRVEGLAPGLYYYHPKNHQLHFVSNISVSEELHYSHNRKTVLAAAFSLYLIGDLDAIVPLYGEIGRDSCFLEAGAMGQLLRAHGPDYGIGVCQIGHFQFGPVEHGFKLSKNQILLASLIGGSIAIATATDGDRSAISLKQFKHDLAGYLAANLPQHMQPARIVALSALPATANGKVDRAALPDPGPVVDQSLQACVPPKNRLETVISELWKELLDLDQVSVERNFFELGANSMLIVKAYHRLRDLIDHTFPLISMFRYPTTRSLARCIDGETSTEDRVTSKARAEKRKQQFNAARRQRKERN